MTSRQWYNNYYQKRKVIATCSPSIHASNRIGHRVLMAHCQAIYSIVSTHPEIIIAYKCAPQRASATAHAALAQTRFVKIPK